MRSDETKTHKITEIYQVQYIPSCLSFLEYQIGLLANDAKPSIFYFNLCFV